MNKDEEILNRLEVIIKLLGRMAYTDDVIRDIVSFKKQNPDKYIAGYNACDGTHNFSEIAKIVGVAMGTLSPILQEWENKMILYSEEKDGNKFYKHLFRIEQKKRK